MTTYQQKNVKLILGDSIEYMSKMADATVDVIIADPPYFLSNDGVTNSGGKQVSVNKGTWDKLPVGITQEDYYRKFLTECKRILKKDGTIWIFGTMHNIYTVGYLLQTLNYRILNNITWQKLNPPPNLGRRMFTHSTETIIWASRSKQSKHYFNYDLMRKENGGKQMKDVWTTPLTKPSEKKFGHHPTQKPLSLYTRILRSSTTEDMQVFDPFLGSGTSALAALLLNRKLTGIEIESKYFALSERRLESQELNLF